MSLISPITNGKPNLEIGKVYQLHINGDTHYFFWAKDNNEKLLVESYQFLTLIDLELKEHGTYYFTFIVNDKQLIYRAAAMDCIKYFCNFKEIV